MDSDDLQLIWEHARRPLLVGVLGLLGFLLLVPLFTYIYFARDIKDKESIMNRNNGGVTLVDRNGKEFFSFYQPKQKTYVTLTDIPLFAQKAAISSEDKQFYTHNGFSVSGIARAFVTDIFTRQLAYGGSTITQQLVKNALLTSQKNFLRKYEELVLSFEIERKFSKQDILEMYLNSVYFGEGATGIENASETYFSKHAKDLTLGEAALLIGILPSPSTYSPLSNAPSIAQRQEGIVLSDMVKDTIISQADADFAQRQKIIFRPKPELPTNIAAPHFALSIKDQLTKQYGEEYLARSGFIVKTTIDLPLQQYAETIVKQQISYLKYNKATNGAAVVIDPSNGEILAYVGSIDWNNDQFGKVDMVNTPRQPGSSFKPIVYAKAMEDRDITTATVLHDVPTTFTGNYKPLDYDRRFRGDVLVRRALSNSLNIPAVEVMQTIGIASALDMAKTLGISTLKQTSDYGLSLVLGSGETKLLEMTNVYATFANQGKYTPTSGILEIKDKYGEKTFTYQPQDTQALSPEVSFLISSILSDTNARAEEFGNALTISRVAAVKTGTTDEFRNALTIGYTPQVAVGVWVGNNDNTPMDNVAGSLGAAPIWRLIMEHYLLGKPIIKFVPPSAIESQLICYSNGLKSNYATRSAYTEYFLSGTQPSGDCNAPAQPTDIPTDTPAPAQPTDTPIPTDTPEVQPTPTNTPVPTLGPSPTNTTLPTITVPVK